MSGPAIAKAMAWYVANTSKSFFLQGSAIVRLLTLVRWNDIDPLSGVALRVLAITRIPLLQRSQFGSLNSFFRGLPQAFEQPG